eukprot:8030441-Pyramimonas_sp.AAC.1
MSTPSYPRWTKTIWPHCKGTLVLGPIGPRSFRHKALHPAGVLECLVLPGWLLCISRADPTPARTRPPETAPCELAFARSCRPPSGQGGIQDGFQGSHDDNRKGQ